MHVPFVRAAALRYAISTVEDQYDLRLEASRLDYNLATLRIGLADLRLSALHSPEEPFVTADYLSVALPWRVVVGDVAFDDISATNARVFVRRREDGSSNLPRGSEEPGGDPPALRIQRLNIPRLAVDLRDEQAVMFLSMPSIALLLAPDEGYVRLQGDAQLNTETQITHISELNGNASFDGRALHFDNLQMRSDEGSARLDGSLTLIARDPSVDLGARGTIDVTRVARWVVVNGRLPQGDLDFEAATAGTFDRLDTHVSVTSGRLAWQELTVTDLAARARIRPEGTEVEQLTFGFENGRVTATGSLPFDANGSGQLNGSWSGVDAAAATRTLAPGTDVVPSTVVSGELKAEGTGVRRGALVGHHSHGDDVLR